MMRAKKSSDKSSRTLATRVLILSLVMVMCFGFYATHTIINDIKKIEKEQASQNLQLARITTGMIDDYVGTAKQVLIPLANQKDIRTQNYPAVSKWMQWFVSKNPNYCLTTFIDTKGNIKALGVSDKLMENESAWKIGVSNAAQFSKTITANDIKVGGFKYSQISKTSIAYLGYPVFDFASRRVGVIVVALDLTDIQNRIVKTYGNESNKRLVTITDEKGFTIARSVDLKKTIGDITPNSNYILKGMTTLKEGTVQGDFTEGITNSITFSSATSVPWFAYIGTNTEFVQGKIKDEVVSLMIGFLPLMFIAVIGLWWVGRDAQNNSIALKQEAAVDSVTGLWDSSKLMIDFKKEHDRAKRYRQQLSFAMIDIDHYDHFMDVNGHIMADDIICAISQIVKDTVRETDTVYRYSGGEICVLLPSTDKAGADYTARRIVKEVEEREFAGEEKQPNGKLTVSIGMATYPYDSISSEGLIRCADIALSNARKSESSTFESYSDEGTSVSAVG